MARKQRLIGARLFPADRDEIPNGYLDVTDGCITAIGSMPAPDDFDGETIDLAGKAIYPGFIDAHCHLGMWEDGLDFEGDDGNEDTDPATPQLQAIDAINPYDRCFQEAREAGVTTVITGPGSANPIGGQLCAIQTAGICTDDMILKAPIAMKMALGENPKSTYHGKNQAPVTRMATAAIIRENLRQAQEYDRRLQEAEEDEDAEKPDYDAKCEALLPVVRGELPVHFHAHRLDDILTARRIAKEFGLRYVIVHGTAAHLAADLFADEQIDILCGPLLSDRSKPELRDLTPENPAILQKAGVRIAIVTDHPVIPLPYLGVCTGLAIREGLPREEALKAVTINPARIVGIDDLVGSLTPGKRADLVVFDSDPFTIAAKPVAVMIGGKWVSGERASV
ncbi:MAG: amidohydrolase [Clostridia bacterium]|nr:amidohydrolase [Clostridia bacterium]